MTAAAEPRRVEGESSTYLELFLKGRSCAEGNNDDYRHAPSSRRRQLPQDAQQPYGAIIDDELEEFSFGRGRGGSGPVARRFSDLPAPRSPLRRPASTTRASWSNRLDSGTLLEIGEKDRRGPTYTRRRSANDLTWLRSEQDPRIGEEVTVDRAEIHQRWDEPQQATTTRVRNPNAVEAVSSEQIQCHQMQQLNVPYSNRIGEPVPPVETATEPTGAQQARIDSKCATLQNRRFDAPPDGGHGGATCSGQREKTNAGTTARESSVLFWEESEALEAMSAIGCDHNIGAERRETLGRSARGPKLSCLATDLPHRGSAISGLRGGRSAGIARDYVQQQPKLATQTRGRNASGPIRGHYHSPDDRFRSRPLVYSAGHVEGHSRNNLHGRSGSPGSTIRATHAGSRGGMHRARNETEGLVRRGVIATAGRGSYFAASMVAQSDTRSVIADLTRQGDGWFGVGGGRNAPRQSSTTTGGRGEVKTRARVVSASPDLSLGQALRKMGGLVMNNGTKLSAVSVFFSSLDVV